MKTKLFFLVSLFGSLSVFTQADVAFRNLSTEPVIDGTTGLPVATGVAIAGLYYSTDLSAVPDLTVPRDGFTLAGTAPIVTVGSFAGLYSGDVELPATISGQEVLFQVRGWSEGYPDYAAAMAGQSDFPTPLVGASNLMRVFYATGGTLPPLNLAPLIQSFTLTPVPEPSTLFLAVLGGLAAAVFRSRRRNSGAA